MKYKSSSTVLSRKPTSNSNEIPLNTPSQDIVKVTVKHRVNLDLNVCLLDLVQGVREKLIAKEVKEESKSMPTPWPWEC